MNTLATVACMIRIMRSVRKTQHVEAFREIKPSYTAQLEVLERAIQRASVLSTSNELALLIG